MQDLNDGVRYETITRETYCGMVYENPRDWHDPLKSMFFLNRYPKRLYVIDWNHKQTNPER